MKAALWRKDRVLQGIIMRHNIIAVLILLLLPSIMPAARHPMSPLAAQAQQEKEEDLGKIADELKFDNARHFYEMRLYDKCLRESREYLEIYVNGAFRKEAYWLIGSIYFDRFDYRRAIRYYQTLYNEFSTHEDGIKGYYQTGICYLKMGYDKKAHRVFTRLIEDHQDSIYSEQAKTQLSLLNIIGDKTPRETSRDSSAAKDLQKARPASRSTNQPGQAPPAPDEQVQEVLLNEPVLAPPPPARPPGDVQPKAR